MKNFSSFEIVLQVNFSAKTVVTYNFFINFQIKSSRIDTTFYFYIYICDCAAKMRQIIKVFERFRPKFFSVMQPTNIRMEDALKRIFYSSVNSVKPSELITKNKLLRLIDENSRQYIEINQKNSLRKFDVTNKNIHLGKR